MSTVHFVEAFPELELTQDEYDVAHITAVLGKDESKFKAMNVKKNYLAALFENSKPINGSSFANPSVDARRLMPFYRFVSLHFIPGIYCIRPMHSKHIKVGLASSVTNRFDGYLTCFPNGFDILWVVGVKKSELTSMEQFAFKTLVGNGVKRLHSVRNSGFSEWFEMPATRSELISKVYSVPDALLRRASFQRLSEQKTADKIETTIQEHYPAIAKKLSKKEYNLFIKNARLYSHTTEEDIKDETFDVITNLLNDNEMKTLVKKVLTVIENPANILMVRHRAVYRRYPGYEGEWVPEQRVDQVMDQELLNILSSEDIVEGLEAIRELPGEEAIITDDADDIVERVVRSSTKDQREEVPVDPKTLPAALRRLLN